jgi:ABC-type multidrug transport system permease subunit
VAAHEVGHRPSTPALIWGQFRYSTRSFWRTPVAAFFTLVFPATFLVVISAIAGNAVVDDRSGIRLAQFLAPVFAVFGICMASFVSLALGVAYAREAGVLKRLRATPLPSWVHLAGRILTAMFVSLLALLFLVGIGVLFYDVEIVWRTLPAVLLTVVVGVFCFAALGLAAVSIAPTPGATQALTNGGLILLAFISDIFIVQLPDWLDSVGWVFPLKHFVNAVADGFNPFLAGNGIYWDHLAVMAAWGIVGVVVALLLFRWEPRPSHRERVRHRAEDTTMTAADEASARALATARSLTPPRRGDPPTRWAVVRGQVRYSTLGVLRDPMSVFFAVVFPVLLLVFFSAIYGREVLWGGMPLPQYLAAAFSVYGVAVMAYVNISGGVVDDRSRRILKRLRGTPLPPAAYIAGRVGAALVLGLMTVALVFGVGAAFFGVRVGPWALLLTVAVYVLIIASAAALGMLLASLVDSPQSAIALALATLLPLSMISDIFVNAPDLPPVLSTIAWIFPLRHMSWLATQTAYGAGIGSEWLMHAAAVAVWGAVAALLAWRLFRWEPRRSE